MKTIMKSIIIGVLLLLVGCYIQPKTNYGTTAPRSVPANNGYYNNNGYNNNGYYNSNGHYNNGYRNGAGHQNQTTYPNRDREIRDHRYDNDHHENRGGQYHQDGHRSEGRRGRY